MSFFRELALAQRLSSRPSRGLYVPGRRFAFGGIFVGIIPASAGDTPMALKELEVRYATSGQKITNSPTAKASTFSSAPTAPSCGG